jgi:hypothetical protein
MLSLWITKENFDFKRDSYILYTVKGRKFCARWSSLTIGAYFHKIRDSLIFGVHTAVHDTNIFASLKKKRASISANCVFSEHNNDSTRLSP